MSKTPIISIELIPAAPSDQVIDRLIDLVNRAERMRGLLAFWTLAAEELGPNLPHVLANGGFLCLDIHRPTDIDRLDDVLAELHLLLVVLQLVCDPFRMKYQVFQILLLA